MCLAVYIATNQELPILKWIKDQTVISFSPLHQKDEPVKNIFTKGNAYYINSHEECGCGFLLDGKKGEDFKKGRESYAALADFLKDNIKERDVEIFSCWEGDQDRPPSHYMQIDFNELRKEKFLFSG